MPSLKGRALDRLVSILGRCVNTSCMRYTQMSLWRMFQLRLSLLVKKMSKRIERMIRRRTPMLCQHSLQGLLADELCQQELLGALWWLPGMHALQVQILQRILQDQRSHQELLQEVDTTRQNSLVQPKKESAISGRVGRLDFSFLFKEWLEKPKSSEWMAGKPKPKHKYQRTVPATGCPAMVQQQPTQIVNHKWLEKPKVTKWMAGKPNQFHSQT